MTADPDTRITVLGTATGIESDLVPARGYDLRTIERVPLPRRPSPQLFTLPQRFRRTVSEVEQIIAEVGADVVVGFGGYVATPAYRAARRRGVPVVLHEQNVRPGLANRWGARSASVVATTFADTPLRNAHHIGLPLQPAIARLAAARDARTDTDIVASAAARWNIDPARNVLVITGGSLGAQRINEAVVAAVADLVGMAQVVHLTGRGKQREALAARERLPSDLQQDYHVVEYTTEIDQLFALADLVVCRAGAGTVCELSALGLPAVYVPLPIGNGEQARNAREVVAAGGARLVADHDLTANRLVTEVRALLDDPDRLVRSAQRSRGVGITTATEKLVALIQEAASGPVKSSRAPNGGE